MSSTIKCLICGFECKGLTLHLKYRHNKTPDQYRSDFPNAEIFSKSVRKQMSMNNFTAKNPKSLEEKFGKEKSDLIKSKIGQKSGASRKGLKRPNQGESIKITWDKKRDEWVAGIRAGKTDEVREKNRIAAKAYIEKYGYHLARGRETKLEKFVRHTLEKNNFKVIMQKGTKKSTLGTIRFFDIFVPELNLLIECDGEYWHCRKDRVEIDIQKNYAASVEGFKLLRISDSELSKRYTECDEKHILRLIEMTDEQLISKTNLLIEHRKKKLNMI